MKLRNFFLAIAITGISAGAALAQLTGTAAQQAVTRGNEQFAREQYRAAIVSYGQVQPGSGDLYAQAQYNSGVCYFEMNNVDPAIGFYRRAITAHRNGYPQASYALGLALEWKNDLAGARNAYEQAVDASNGKFRAAQYRLDMLANQTASAK